MLQELFTTEISKLEESVDIHVYTKHTRRKIVCNVAFFEDNYHTPNYLGRCGNLFVVWKIRLFLLISPDIHGVTICINLKTFLYFHNVSNVRIFHFHDVVYK